MDETSGSTHSSICVAPLRIDKAKRTSSNASRTSRSSRTRNSQTHSRTRSSGAHSQTSSSNQQITPPLTPHSSQESLESLAVSEADFHPFLRAFYPFHPTYTSDSSTVTLPLNAGDLVLVHSIHTNGWADGTMLSSGARGWLPTNYCETYETTHIRLLLKACLNLFDQFRLGSSDAGVKVDQIAVTAIVAGVRHLLESAECLTREAQNVRSSDDIRKSRKVLLAELSGLVKAAKKLSDQNSREHPDDITDELIMRSFKIVLRGVRFLDIWEELYELTSSYIDSYNEDEYMEDAVPPTPPPCDSLATEETNADAYFGSRLTGRNQGLTNESHPLPSTPYMQTPHTSVALLNHHQILDRDSECTPATVCALAQLNITHDILLSYLGSYIGRIHLQARFTPQLQLTQQQSVAAARDLLAVVEVVYARDPRATALEAAKEAMYDRISSLVSAAKEIVSNPIEEMDEEDGILIPDGGRSLVEAATGCVRGAGDCVAKSKFVIERIGDFELEPAIGLGIMTDLAPTPTEEVKDDIMEVCEGGNDREMMPPPPPPTPDKTPPPLPPKEPRHLPALPLTVDTNVQLTSAVVVPPSPEAVRSPQTTTSRRSSTTSLLPPLPNVSPLAAPGESKKDADAKSLFNKSIRADSISAESISATDSINSIRGSDFSILSQTSTRASTPEPASSTSISTPVLSTDLTALGGGRVSLVSGIGAERISDSHAEDLTFNKDGQITGGTLPALIERLTVHDSTPDAVFVATFYLTFRLFTTPKDFAQALVDRFNAVAAVSGGMPVRLRVYNVFKGWLESHWRDTTDGEAREVITNFAETTLKELLPAAAKRLRELADKVSEADGPLVPRSVCGMGNTTTYGVPETPIPAPSISRSQLSALKVALTPGGLPVSILDFEPIELARQFALKESRIFCSIRPEELLAQEWTKKKGSIATGVLGMSSLSTDLAHLVAETILDVHDIKKRAVVIKHWIKIADRCLELNNYDSLMAIMCTLNTSTIVRLKKTWELVSYKSKQVLENLRAVIDVSKNHAVLRARLRGHVPPCLPFLGTYLTDLTFVDVGNPSKRPVSMEGSTKQVINFDKHVKTARIISEIQRFQIPYRITEVPEMQSWIDNQIARIHNSKAADVQHLYRRSLLLEPRENQVPQPTPETQSPPPPVPPKEPTSVKTDLFAWAHVFKTPAN